MITLSEMSILLEARVFFSGINAVTSDLARLQRSLNRLTTDSQKQVARLNAWGNRLIWTTAGLGVAGIGAAEKFLDFTRIQQQIEGVGVSWEEFLKYTKSEPIFPTENLARAVFLVSQYGLKWQQVVPHIVRIQAGIYPGDLDLDRLARAYAQYVATGKAQQEWADRGITLNDQVVASYFKIDKAAVTTTHRIKYMAETISRMSAGAYERIASGPIGLLGRIRDKMDLQMAAIGRGMWRTVGGWMRTLERFLNWLDEHANIADKLGAMLPRAAMITAAGAAYMKLRGYIAALSTATDVAVLAQRQERREEQAKIGVATKNAQAIREEALARKELAQSIATSMLAGREPLPRSAFVFRDPRTGRFVSRATAMGKKGMQVTPIPRLGTGMQLAQEGELGRLAGKDVFWRDPISGKFVPFGAVPFGAEPTNIPRPSIVGAVLAGGATAAGAAAAKKELSLLARTRQAASKGLGAVRSKVAALSRPSIARTFGVGEFASRGLQAYIYYQLGSMAGDLISGMSQTTPEGQKLGNRVVINGVEFTRVGKGWRSRIVGGVGVMGGFLRRTLQGAAIGTIAGPWGTAAGAVGGAVYALARVRADRRALVQAAREELKRRLAAEKPVKLPTMAEAPTEEKKPEEEKTFLELMLEKAAEASDLLDNWLQRLQAQGATESQIVEALKRKAQMLQDWAKYLESIGASAVTVQGYLLDADRALAEARDIVNMQTVERVREFSQQAELLTAAARAGLYPERAARFMMERALIAGIMEPQTRREYLMQAVRWIAEEREQAWQLGPGRWFGGVPGEGITTAELLRAARGQWEPGGVLKIDFTLSVPVNKHLEEAVRQGLAQEGAVTANSLLSQLAQAG